MNGMDGGVDKGANEHRISVGKSKTIAHRGIGIHILQLITLYNLNPSNLT